MRTHSAGSVRTIRVTGGERLRRYNLMRESLSDANISLSALRVAREVMKGRNDVWAMLNGVVVAREARTEYVAKATYADGTTSQGSRFDCLPAAQDFARHASTFEDIDRTFVTTANSGAVVSIFVDGAALGSRRSHIARYRRLANS